MARDTFTVGVESAPGHLICSHTCTLASEQLYKCTNVQMYSGGLHCCHLAPPPDPQSVQERDKIKAGALNLLLCAPRDTVGNLLRQLLFSHCFFWSGHAAYEQCYAR